MAELIPDSSLKTLYMGWYGTCPEDGADECPAFPLVTGSLMTSAHAVPGIQQITEITTGGGGESIYDGMKPNGIQLHFSQLKELTCGRSYRIAVQPGTDPIVIPEFTFADAGTPDTHRLTTTCGGASTTGPTIEFVSLSDKGDLRIDIAVDLTSLENVCSSNEWKYTIKDASDVVVYENVAGGVATSAVSGYLPRGGETYTVTIWGTDDIGVKITDEVSDTIAIEWPPPSLGINPDTVDRSYIEGKGPSSAQKLTLSKYLVKSLRVNGYNLPTAPAGQIDAWHYRPSAAPSWSWQSFDTGWVSVADDENEIYVRLREGLSPNVGREHDAKITFEYEGENGLLYQKDVSLEGDVLDRVITISSLTDNLDSYALIEVSRTHVTHWFFKVEAPDGTLIHNQSDFTPKNGTGHLHYIDIQASGEGLYKFIVWGVEEINGVWTAITPEDEDTVQIIWPDPVLEVTPNYITETYVEGEGPSPGNSVLTRTSEWIWFDYFHAPDNSNPVAWEYRNFDQNVWQDVPTTPSGSNTHTKFVYRLKEGLSEGNYDMDVIYIGEQPKNGDPDLQVTRELRGTVQPKPDCCLGFQNTFPTTGDNSSVDPIDNVVVYGFENGGSLCYHDASEGEMKIFDVNLKNASGQVVGGGAMLVFGALSNPEVIYTSVGEVCYRGNVTSDTSMNYLLEE